MAGEKQEAGKETIDLSSEGITLSKNYLIDPEGRWVIDTITGSGIPLKINKYTDEFGAEKYSLEIGVKGGENHLGKKGVFPCVLALNKEQYETFEQLYEKQKSGGVLRIGEADGVVEEVAGPESETYNNLVEAVFPSKVHRRAKH